MSTKVEQVDTKDYIKAVIKVNMSAIIIMSWFMISGLLSSYYCVLSASQMIQLCLATFEPDMGESKVAEEKVPWHDFVSQKDEKSKPITVEQEITFVAQDTNDSLKTCFLNKWRNDIKSDEKTNETDTRYHRIASIELHGIITKSVEWNCTVISHSFEFIKKITNGGVLLMTSFIIFPMFLLMYFILNFFYTIFAWFNSIYGAFKRCKIIEYLDTVLHKKEGNVDPNALSIVSSLFFLLFYAIITPAFCFITIIPILVYLLITLLLVPLYALFIPLKITGKLGPKNSIKNTPFNLGTSMFSNIYTYINYYSVAFSIVYAIVASLLQDAYYFVGCLVAIALVWMATSFYKQQPFMGGSNGDDEEISEGEGAGEVKGEVKGEVGGEVVKEVGGAVEGGEVEGISDDEFRLRFNNLAVKARKQHIENEKVVTSAKPLDKASELISGAPLDETSSGPLVVKSVELTSDEPLGKASAVTSGAPLDETSSGPLVVKSDEPLVKPSAVKSAETLGEPLGVTSDEPLVEPSVTTTDNDKRLKQEQQILEANKNADVFQMMAKSGGNKNNKNNKNNKSRRKTIKQ